MENFNSVSYLNSVGITSNFEKAVYSTARLIASRYFVTNKKAIQCGRENLAEGYPVNTARKYTNPDSSTEIVVGMDYNDKAYRKARVDEMLNMPLEQVLEINQTVRALNEIGRESNANYKNRLEWEAANQYQLQTA